MKLEEHCLEAEARLRGLEERLREFRPEAMDHCLQEIPRVLDSLQQWIASPGPVDARDRDALKTLRETTGRLLLRAEYGNHLCQGWIQLRLGVGYTNQGRPWVLGAESSATYEG